MTSSGRELLKWLAVILMTGDHAAKLLYGGYVPVVFELGRLAFPIFALVMAYNLAQPGADVAKSVKRLFVWGVIAQPVYVWAFGALLPVNVLLSFALAAACVLCAQNRRWGLLAVLAGPLPLFVDYQWSGVVLVLAWWWAYKLRYESRVGLVDLDALELRGWTAVCAFIPLCLYNANAWALLALPVMQLSNFDMQVPRTRWAFYIYYVVHLALLSLFS